MLVELLRRADARCPGPASAARRSRSAGSCCLRRRTGLHWRDRRRARSAPETSRGAEGRGRVHAAVAGEAVPGSPGPSVEGELGHRLAADVDEEVAAVGIDGEAALRDRFAELPFVRPEISVELTPLKRSTASAVARRRRRCRRRRRRSRTAGSRLRVRARMSKVPSSSNSKSSSSPLKFFEDADVERSVLADREPRDRSERPLRRRRSVQNPVVSPAGDQIAGGVVLADHVRCRCRRRRCRRRMARPRRRRRRTADSGHEPKLWS